MGVGRQYVPNESVKSTINVKPVGTGRSFFQPKPTVVQRKCNVCEDEERQEKETPHLQRKIADIGLVQADDAFEHYVAGLAGRGVPLPSSERTFFESRFNRDLSAVRIHTDPGAVASARHIRARAYTTGNHIVFDQGQFQPGTDKGRWLLAHELTHVSQQHGSMAAGQVQRETDSSSCVSPIGELIIPTEQLQSRTDTEYVGEYDDTPATVTAEKGIRLHMTPDPNDEDYVGCIGVSAKVFAQGMPLDIIATGNADHTGWVKIRIGEESYEGWIEARYVARKSKPDPTKDAVTLITHRVEKGDTLDGLVKRYYPDYPYATGNDRRTIVHAFAILNEGNPAIYFVGDGTSWKDLFDPEFAKTRDIYQTIRLYAGHEIRFPSVAYIDYLRADGRVGVRPEWKNEAIAFARIVEGFLDGVVSGFAKAAWDTVKGLWDLVKSIFTGELKEQAYALYSFIWDNGLAGIKQLVVEYVSGLIRDFEETWRKSSPYQKGKLIGELVGAILLEVVIAYVTGGAGALRHSTKIGKVLDAFPALKKVFGKVGKHLDDVPKKGKINVAKLGKVERQIEELGEVTAETRKMFRNPRHGPTLESLTEHKRAARALKKCASPCYKDFLQPRQVDELEEILKRAEIHGMPVDYEVLKTFLHDAKNVDHLDEKIEVLRHGFDRMLSDKSRGVSPFEIDRLVKAEKMRDMPGTISGGERLKVVTEKNVEAWYGMDPKKSKNKHLAPGHIMLPPKQVVDKVKKQFQGKKVTFRQLREAFWKEMYNDPVIRKFFEDRGGARSLAEMKAGRAPFALEGGRTGRGVNAKMQLNHQQALEHLGDRVDEVLNFDNLEIVSPVFHEAMKQ